MAASGILSLFGPIDSGNPNELTEMRILNNPGWLVEACNNAVGTFKPVSSRISFVVTIFILTAITTSSVCGQSTKSQDAESSKSPIRWSALPPIPNTLGVAGPIAGSSNNALIVGGGANFPSAPPWLGGTKVWHDNVHVLESMNARTLNAPTWIDAGRLPRPLGYSVCVTLPEGLKVSAGVACFGGSDSRQHYRDCFLMRWADEKLSYQSLPSMPAPCANASGVLVGSVVYIAGGLGQPTETDAMNTFWALDLNSTPLVWKELPAWPGPARMLAAMVAVNDTIYLCSGVKLAAGSDGKAVREYLNDGYAYHPEKGWSALPNAPRAAVAATVLQTGDLEFQILGGDDGSLINFQPPEQHPGFPKSALSYSIAEKKWKVIENALPESLVTTTIVPWNGKYVMPSGEIRPGVRSPKVWQIELDPAPVQRETPK